MVANDAGKGVKNPSTLTITIITTIRSNLLLYSTMTTTTKMIRLLLLLSMLARVSVRIILFHHSDFRRGIFGGSLSRDFIFAGGAALSSSSSSSSPASLSSSTSRLADFGIVWIAMDVFAAAIARCARRKFSCRRFPPPRLRCAARLLLAAASLGHIVLPVSVVGSLLNYGVASRLISLVSQVSSRLVGHVLFTW